MKSPLEPIPTEPVSSAQNVEHAPLNQPLSNPAANTRMSKAYPLLLGAIVCLSGALCWMYITKPVIVSTPPQQPAASLLTVEKDVTEVTGVKLGKEASVESDLVPSEDALPGETPSGNRTAASAKSGKLPAGVKPGVRWENTNLKVQHILRAMTENGEQKIILDVPVRYETRTMRWTKEDIAEARNILSRLMIYERDLNNLRQQGKGVLNDWNLLLGRTAPATVLRADSPSLPYNQGHGNQPRDLPDGSSLIKVDDGKPAAE